MSSLVITLVVIFGLSLAVAAIFVVRRQRLKADLQMLSEEDRRRHADILVAEKAVIASQKCYERAVGMAWKSMMEARTPAVLARCGAAVLSETSIILSGQVRTLSAGIAVYVDASGDVQKFATSRTTATRVVAGGALFGPVGAIVGGGAKKNRVHTQDTRQLFLVVTGPGWQEIVQVDPNLSVQARQFAAAVYTSSAHADQLLQQFQTRVAETSRLHQMAVADTSTLEADRSARAVLNLDPLSELRSARAALKLRNRAHSQQISGTER